jgi:hypothetical protein
MSRFFFILAFILILNDAFSQQPDSTQVDIVDFIFGKKRTKKTDEKRIAKKTHFSILPGAVNVPGGGSAVITAINAAFYLGDPSTTNLSNIYLIPYTNLGSRYGLYVRPNLWYDKNILNLVGDYRIAHFPQYSWGLGGNSPQWDRSLIDADFLRIYQTILLRVFRTWYIGTGYALDYHYNIEESEFSIEGGHLGRYPLENTDKTTSSGLTFNLVNDIRKNSINPTQGHYFQFVWRWNDTNMGSTYTNNSLFIDARKYIPIYKNYRNHILSLRSYYWTVLNGDTPYLDLPATNWAPSSGISGRGFESGRYRSNAMLYTEAEQRTQLTKNGLWGFVAFLNASSASEFDTQQFKHWKFGGGVGLRVKFNKYSNSNLAIDLGFSENYWGVWLNIGEMF